MEAVAGSYYKLSSEKSTILRGLSNLLYYGNSENSVRERRGVSKIFLKAGKLIFGFEESENGRSFATSPIDEMIVANGRLTGISSSGAGFSADLKETWGINKLPNGMPILASHYGILTTPCNLSSKPARVYIEFAVSPSSNKNCKVVLTSEGGNSTILTLDSATYKACKQGGYVLTIKTVNNHSYIVAL